MLKKFIAVMIIGMFLFSSLPIKTKGDAELPEWNIGDKWKYEKEVPGKDITGKPVVGKIYEERVVKEITTITVNGTDYEVYVVDIKRYTGLIGISFTEYITTSNLALVKEEISNVSTIYTPPKDIYDFPIKLNENWDVSYKSIRSTDDYNYTSSDYYECIEIKEITVKAGTYEVYVIRTGNPYATSGSYYLYYSPEVKNVVKEEEEDKNGNKTVRWELVPFGEEPKKEENFLFQEIFGIQLIYIIGILILILIISSIFLMRKRKLKATMQQQNVPQIHQQPYQQILQYPQQTYQPQPTYQPVKVRCGKCGNTIDITTPQRPIEFQCNNCGAKLRLS